jgi:phosphonopyruvate decarboxylase
MVDEGIDFLTGVPCSLMTALVDSAIATGLMPHVPATHEGEALGIAVGAWLAGRRPAVYLQNSGLGNLVNPATSLCDPFRAPVLLLMSWRGQPGFHDEPQHHRMGQITMDQLRLLDIDATLLPETATAAAAALRSAMLKADAGKFPTALVVRRGLFPDTHAAPSSSRPEPRIINIGEYGMDTDAMPTRTEALTTLNSELPDRVGIIATTGKTGRELWALGDRPQNLYLVGSMGLASAVGLGVALNTTLPIVVIDGDGAALMKLGNLSTIGHMQPANLIHIILDNNVHDSTGGQPTAAVNTDFPKVAAACGYRSAIYCKGLQGLRDGLGQALTTGGPTLLHLHIAVGSPKDLDRPNVTPEAVALRFQKFLTETS